MNKKLLAVALASAFAAPAMADGVQIYGAFDVGVLVRGSATDANKAAGASGNYSTVASGMNGHNGIGFKMSEDLGNGMTLSGDAMFGFALDAAGSNDAGLNPGGTGGFNTIYSYLALSGDFGTLIGGRAGGARAGFIKQYDPFGGFGVGGALQTANSGLGNADYADNVLAWITPEVVPGLKGLFAYTSNLVGQDQVSRSANAPGTALYAAAALYNAGPVSLTAAYENLTLDGASTDHRDVWTGAGSYDFGVVKVMALYHNIEGNNRGWQAGLSAPLTGQTAVKLGYSTSTVSGTAGDAKCSKIAAGVNYDMSKRTRLYADVAHLIDDDAQSACENGLNTNGGSYTNNGAARDNGVGFGRTGANVGIRHSF